MDYTINWSNEFNSLANIYALLGRLFQLKIKQFEFTAWHGLRPPPTPQLVLCVSQSERSQTANLSRPLALTGRWCALLNVCRTTPTAAS